MRDKDKDRDPEKARKRAKADARCALRKLGLLEKLEDAVHPENADMLEELSADFALALAAQLDLKTE